MRNFKWVIGFFLALFLLGMYVKSYGALDNPLTMIELETPVHYLAPDGSDLQIEAGTYTIEPAEEWLRLMSGERHDAVLIEATKGTHELDLPDPLGLSLPGESEAEADLHHLLLMLPGGQSLEASGTYSGIRPRGSFQNTFDRMKKKAHQAYKHARSTAKSTVSKAKRRAHEVKKQAQQTAKKKLEQAKQRVKKFQKHGQQKLTQAQQAAKNKLDLAKKKAHRAKTYGQQTVTQGVQWARNSALRAKHQVESNARKRAAQVRSKIQKAKRIVSNKLGPWPRFSQLASVAARQEARAWLRQMYVDSRKCKVRANVLEGLPGVLKSRYAFQGKIAKALKAAGASQRIAEAWDSAFKESWERWAKHAKLLGIAAYPAFDLFPGPKAPPTPSVSFPIGYGQAIGSGFSMSSHMLSKKLLAKLGSYAKHQQVKNAVLAFATDLGQRHAACLGACLLAKVMGSGRVPSYAPPLVPAGPVQGTCKGGVLLSTAAFEGS